MQNSVMSVQESLSTSTKKQHEMLVKVFSMGLSRLKKQLKVITFEPQALNLQLTISASFLFGCFLYTFNLAMGNLFPSFPSTSFIVIPVGFCMVFASNDGYSTDLQSAECNHCNEQPLCVHAVSKVRSKHLITIFFHLSFSPKVPETVLMRYPREPKSQL